LKACHEAKKAETERNEPDPGMMQSVGKHQEVPKEEAAVIPVTGLRKQRRDQNLAMGRRQKPKGRIWASLVSRKRLTIAGRKLSRRARVAWPKRNIARRDCTRANVVQEAQSARVLRRRLRSQQGGGEGIRDVGGIRPLYRRKRRPTKDGIRGCKSGHRSPLGSRGTRNKTLYEIVSIKIVRQIAGTVKKTIGLGFGKRVFGISRGIQRRNWSLWRG
jgi:hypothetical protein